MSDFVKVKKLTNAAGTGAINFPNGINIAGSDSGITGTKHTVSGTEPSTPANGDTWYDTANSIYYVRMDNAWKNWLGTPPVTVNWAGSRGMGVGGQDSNGKLNTLQYFDLSTTGNATDFGDLTEAINNCTASSNGSRGVRIGGSISASTDTIDYWTFATTGNATDFGNTLSSPNATRQATVGNGARAITSGGGTYSNVIQYITIATTGDAQDFGDLITGLIDHFSTNDDTRGIFAGGNNQLDQTRKEMMDYITMATTGNSTDFGDLNTPTVSSGVGIVSDNTTGLFMGGGNTYSNQILKVTIATTGNSSDFGDLTASKAYLGQTSYPTNARGVAMSGYLSSGSVTYNVIEYVTISTPGNAQDFGDLLSASERVAGTSGNAS